MKINSYIVSVTMVLLLAMGMCKDIDLEGRPTVSDEDGRPLSFLLIIPTYFVVIDRAAGRFQKPGDKRGLQDPLEAKLHMTMGSGYQPHKIAAVLTF